MKKTTCLLLLLLALPLVGCARFNSTIYEGPDGDKETRVTAWTLWDSKSELSKLSSGQTDKSQKVTLGALNQESSATNALSFAESVVGAAVRAAVKP